MVTRNDKGGRIQQFRTARRAVHLVTPKLLLPGQAARVWHDHGEVLEFTQLRRYFESAEGILARHSGDVSQACAGTDQENRRAHSRLD